MAVGIDLDWMPGVLAGRRRVAGMADHLGEVLVERAAASDVQHL